jgi:hypothetical protein
VPCGYTETTPFQRKNFDVTGATILTWFLCYDIYYGVVIFYVYRSVVNLLLSVYQLCISLSSVDNCIKVSIMVYNWN